MLTFLKYICLVVLYILWSPLFLIGMISGYLYETRTCKKRGVSFSAGQALQYRWMMHMFGTRDDPDTIRFTKAFPCESHILMWFVLGPIIITYRYLGLRTGLSKLVEPRYEPLSKVAGMRVVAFDRVMEKYIDQVDQVVIPGAGFDLLAQRYTKDKGVAVFEIDQTNTSKVKVESLKKAGLPYEWIHYIPVDYSTESWSKKLLDAGFDKTKKTLFIWQTVSMYLDEHLIEETITLMRDLSAPGSIIVQDFYSTAFFDGSISKTAAKGIEVIVKQGEPVKFSLDMSEDPKKVVHDYVEKFDLEVSTYYQFGEKISAPPVYVIVESIIK